MERRALLRLGLGALAGASAMGLAGRRAGAQAPSAGPVITRPIPSSGEALPVVGLGTWITFDIGRDPAARRRRREVLETLFAGGGTVIDSSPMYGRAEGVVGDLLAEMGARARAFLATKVWTEGAERGRRQMEESFSLFRTDRIELMQIHNLVDWRAHLPTLRAWKEEGRFRYIGITHYTPGAFDRVMSVLAHERLDFVQIPYSIAVREAESRLLPLAVEREVAVIANRPFEGGNLFGKVRGRDLPAWAREFDCESWAQFFLKFLLGHPAMTCVIPGTERPDYMRDNLGAARGRLPDGPTRERMARLVAEL